mmetsp:Transcript_702/g.950  ORF Transcript_702/g.950 Transcript_702/m.950 type:complete len:185 (-) Transcript_702:73-627(-)
MKNSKFIWPLHQILVHPLVSDYYRLEKIFHCLMTLNWLHLTQLLTVKIHCRFVVQYVMHSLVFFSCCTGGEDIRVYAPACFSLSFGATLLDLQADSPASKQQFLSAFEALTDHLTSPGGRIFHEIKQQKHQRAVVERRRQIRTADPRAQKAASRASAIRDKYRSGVRSSPKTGGSRARIEQLKL